MLSFQKYLRPVLLEKYFVLSSGSIVSCHSDLSPRPLVLGSLFSCLSPLFFSVSHCYIPLFFFLLMLECRPAALKWFSIFMISKSKPTNLSFLQKLKKCIYPTYYSTQPLRYKLASWSQNSSFTPSKVFALFFSNSWVLITISSVEQG